MKGQVSLDLILAIAFAFVVVGGLMLVGNDLISMQKQASVRHQLEAVNSRLSDIGISSAILLDGDQASASIYVPLLLVPEEEKPRACEITLNPNWLMTKYDIYDLETGDLEVEVNIKKAYKEPEIKSSGGGSMDLTPNNPQCGETITFTKS